MVSYEVHVSSYCWRSQIWRKRSISRRMMLISREVYPVNSYVLACVEIQRIWRGVLLRRRVLAKYLYNNFRRAAQDRDERAMVAYHQLPTLNDSLLVSIARRAASHARTVLHRAEYLRWLAYQKYTIYYIAASTIARAWKAYRIRCLPAAEGVTQKTKQPAFYLTPEDAAAARIQSAWKAYINKQIFRFYVDLIKFREAGDAALMLRCINPKEAGLIDSAARIHLRFRLGGEAFPPTIYYKIFTHGPVCDLGSLAPRNYTKEKHIHPKQLHNHGPLAAAPDKSEWYHRVENNNWRPITERALREADQQWQTIVQAKKGFTKESDFHYSRVVRKQDKEEKARRKKRDWMLRLYTQVFPYRSAEEQLAISQSLPRLGDKELLDEVNALVGWASELDFDAYRSDWAHMATAAGPDLLSASFA
eukprot:TRINITY_DN26368_c0_g1_i1.p1 TRINITY_DN26368_c0_g1~~TRINITY_DN26368_c0_g1_i1.p1  ORF type:complete len:419 (-),score=47.43 TRINITY_DN26368_c0_g1_i1:9-1265(-)